MGDSQNPDPLDFVEVDLVTGAVVKLGRLRAFVVGDLLGVFDSASPPITDQPNDARKRCGSGMESYQNGWHHMFEGYIRAFSDVGKCAELLLTQVSVYDEKTSELCYQADRIYLARKKDDLTIEFHDPPHGEESSNGRQDDKAVAQAGDSDSPVTGRNGSEREPESAQHQHVPPTQAGGELPPKQQQ